MGKYETNVLPKLNAVRSMAREGLSIKQIAKQLYIADSTFRAYAAKYPELKEALKEGKEEADAKVENGVFFSACGGIKTIKKAIKLKKPIFDKYNKKIGEEEVIAYADEEIYCPPNIAAAIFWLCNRQKEKWKHQRNIEFKAKDGKKIEISFGDAEEFTK